MKKAYLLLILLIFTPFFVFAQFLSPVIEPIILENGRVVEFPYTDSLKGETVYIYTDRSHYDQNVSEAEVYFAVKSNKKQFIDFGIKLNGEVTSFDWLILQTRMIEMPIYEKTCKIEYVQSTTTAEQIEQEVCMLELVRTDMSYEDYYAPDSRVLTEKQEDKKKYEIKEELKEGISYGKFTIPIKKGTINEEFWLTAIDEDSKVSVLDPWFSSDWTYRKKIEIDSSKVIATQTNFPVYVDLSDMGSSFFDNTKSDGCDIRIVESDDSTETAFELVAYDNSADTGELHFMADSLSSLATTTFYMYYGNSGASCYASNATYGSQNVWNSNYKGVWHLQDDPDTSTVQDSTVSGYDGNKSVSNEPIEVNGKIGKAQSFDDTDDYIYCGASSNLSFTSSFSYSAWVKITNGVTLLNSITQRQKDGNNFYMLQVGAAGGGYLQGYIRSSGIDYYSRSSSEYNDGNWHYIVVNFDSVNGIKLYVDGSEVSYSHQQGAFTIEAMIPANQYIGLWGSSDECNGTIDELCISNIVTSSTWIAIEYNNQSSPSTFYVVGTQEFEEISFASVIMSSTDLGYAFILFLVSFFSGLVMFGNRL